MINLFHAQFFPVVFQRLREQKLFSPLAADGTFFFWSEIAEYNLWRFYFPTTCVYHVKEPQCERKDLPASVM